MLIIQIRRSELAVMLMVIASPENPVDAWTIGHRSETAC
jgi:hypothetical protein